MSYSRTGGNLSSEPATGNTSGMHERLNETIRLEMRTIAAFDMYSMKSYIENPLVIKLIEGGISPYMEAFASAAFALTFAGRDMHIDDVVKLLDAAGIESDQGVQFFSAVTHILHYKNRRFYMYALYLMKFVGKEPNVEDLLEIVKTMNMTPDAGVAKVTIEFYKEYMSGKYESVTLSPERSPQLKAAFDKFRGIVLEFSSLMSDFFIQELDTTLKNNPKFDTMDPEIYNYLWTLSTLSFAGRDVDKEDVKKLISAVGFKPNDVMLDAIVSLRFRNKLVYIISLYYLISVDAKPTLENVLATAKAMEAIPDAHVAQQAIDYYTTARPSKK